MAPAEMRRVKEFVIDRTAEKFEELTFTSKIFAAVIYMVVWVLIYNLI